MPLGAISSPNSGVIQVGERLKLMRFDATEVRNNLKKIRPGCNLGTIWIALEPEPITATRLPWQE